MIVVYYLWNKLGRKGRPHWGTRNFAPKDQALVQKRYISESAVWSVILVAPFLSSGRATGRTVG